MAFSITNPFALASTAPEWQVLIGTKWMDIDQRSAATMETAFKGSTKTIKIGPSSVLPHVADFDVGAMTWDGMPLRRATARTPGAPVTHDQLFNYWDDDGMWVDYCGYTQDLINSCRRNGRSKTAIYVGTVGYDICLDSMIQYNRDTQRPRPISASGVSSCDDKTLPLKMDYDSTVPDYFICPITQAPMKNPVVAADGHTYERDSIKKAILVKPVSPMTNKPLAHTHLVTNHALRKDMTLFIAKTQPHNVSAAAPAATGSKKRMRVVKTPEATADNEE
jgi:hypothetical protein